MPKDTPQIDHKAQALRLLKEATQGTNLEQALVLSNLAIAEGQERAAEEIKAFRELMAGSAT